ncbi:4-hydroxy-tetrahydrodipicolinate synthase [Limihaloglobus sulfuriphilus]|uniref:4-hydroxy-tetrahydrodipicolinate synthase n=1 Tax=Limihaloglobus sulfuriphilus TaxID=1851148 RepID=A0A1Q2MCR2_9BACT|nr:dihydrodipicolinate synthase family protein [Limihaloglobus sulfuriphilus]AQQ70493.1 4-hydroxy-tetrahydrodipicolinate synthase [Limihaloglobus sulfuriphilus]
METRLYSAICTPLTEEETLHKDGFKEHIDQQFNNGIYGVLICGTMGNMQLLKDEVYRDAVKYGTEFSAQKGEVFIGVGDASYSRTLARIEFAQQFDVDGLVVLCPYLVKYSQDELVDYFSALADASSKPVYLYDLPVLAGMKISHDTVLKLSKHPNIHGAKCSDIWEDTRILMGKVNSDFRIIPAQPFLVDHLVRMGVSDNLDGVYSICPEYISLLADTAASGNVEKASQMQSRLSSFLMNMRNNFPLHDAFSAILNRRAVQGQIALRPMKRMIERQREELFEIEFVKQITGNNRGKTIQNTKEVINV